MLRITRGKMNKTVTCILVSCLSFLSAANAKTMYTYTSSNGDILLTDTKQDSKAFSKVNITRFPDSNIHTYSNWGNSIASAAKGFEKNKSIYDAHIVRAASKFNIDPGLIKAVMHTESGFNINARSPVGAQGLMQLMPATARRFNVSNAYDPVQNIDGGARYLSWLLKRFNGDVRLALAGYNAGEGNVDKYKGIPPFRETQDYVRRVTQRYNTLYSNLSGRQNVQVVEASFNKANSSTTLTNGNLNYGGNAIVRTSESSYSDVLY